MLLRLKVFAAVFFSLGFLPGSLHSQSTVPVTARGWIEKAAALQKSDRILPRYTYFLLDHTQNRTKTGKLFVDATTLYEYTWIGDLPYGLVVEQQGKALRGKALADEQARYDKAVADHGGLDMDARAKVKHYSLLDTALRLEPLLLPDYILSELRQETLSGNPTHVIDCVPAASGSAATRHAVVWITDSGVILRDTYEVVADESDRLRGSHGQEDWQLIEGTPLPQHTLFHLNAPNGNTGDFEKTFSRFRRFNASIKIVPVGESSGDGSGTPHQ